MNYTAEDISQFFDKYESIVTHNLVAHTKFRPHHSSKAKIDAMTYEAKRNLRYALNIFSKSLYPNQTNLPIRKPDIYRPLSLVTIENIKETTDEQQTIHFNISLGNLPKHLSTTQIEMLFRHAWHIKAKQSNDIFLTHKNDFPATQAKWFGYIVKDANKCRQLAWDTCGTWDVLNTWIPSNAINTD